MEELHCRSRPRGVTSSSRGLAVALGAVALWSKLCCPLLPLVLLGLPSPEPRSLGRCLDAPRPSRAIVPVRQHVITRVTAENGLLESRGSGTGTLPPVLRFGRGSWGLKPGHPEETIYFGIDRDCRVACGCIVATWVGVAASI